MIILSPTNISLKQTDDLKAHDLIYRIIYNYCD